MGFLILLPFAALWYLPLFIKHRRIRREKARYYIFALLMGIVAFICSVIVQGACNLATQKIKPEGFAYELYGFVKVLLTVAVTEELLKYFFGRMILKKVPDLSEAGSMLILGMTGLGFELIESISAADPLSAIFRGITALHIFFQMWMGKYRWRAEQARLAGDLADCKKQRRIALLVPILMHALFDYPILRVSKLAETEDPEETAAVIATVAAIAAIVFGVACMIYLFNTARKTVKAEKESYEAEQAGALAAEQAEAAPEPEAAGPQTAEEQEQ